MRVIHLNLTLSRGELHCLGVTTLDEYYKYIEKDVALEKDVFKRYLLQNLILSTL